MKTTLEEALKNLEDSKFVFRRANDRYISAVDRVQMAQYHYDDAWQTYVRYGRRELAELFQQKSHELDYAIMEYNNAKSYLKISSVKLRKTERTVKKLQRKIEKAKQREERKTEKESSSLFWFN